MGVAAIGCAMVWVLKYAYAIILITITVFFD